MNKPGALITTTISILFFATATLSFGDALAQGQTLKQQLIGTWTLISNDNVAANGSRRQIFGPHPKGILILDASGRYAQIQVNPDRPKFKGKTRLDGTPEENTAVVRATATHFGTWSVNEADKSLTVHQEMNIFPNDDGVDNKRSIALTGDDMKMFNPTPSSGGAAESKWRRAK
jgi:hypothetical protein